MGENVEGLYSVKVTFPERVVDVCEYADSFSQYLSDFYNGITSIPRLNGKENNFLYLVSFDKTKLDKFSKEIKGRNLAKKVEPVSLAQVLPLK